MNEIVSPAIRLVSPSSLDPFSQFPQLNSIWPLDLLEVAREAITEELTKIERLGITAADGRIFLIEKEGRVIGITGYFINQTIVRRKNDEWPFVNYSLYRDEITNLGLRWHGIISDERGHGYSNEVLMLVLEDAVVRFPNTCILTEYAPLTDHGKANISYFTHLGFKPQGSPIEFDWHPAKWQELSLDIHQFMAMNKQDQNLATAYGKDIGLRLRGRGI